MNSYFLEAVIATCCFFESKHTHVDAFKEEGILTCREYASELNIFSDQDIITVLTELKACYNVDAEIGREISLNRLSVLKNKQKIKKAIYIAFIVVSKGELNNDTIVDALYTRFMLGR